MPTFTGTPFDDTLFGTDRYDDIIVGFEGDDALYGLGGNDQLAGYDGNDILDGGIGIDRMFGGDGNDLYMKDNVRDEMAESFDDASGGVDLVWSSVSHTLGYGFEHLALMGVANISGTGNVKDNIIEGNSGRNVLKGGLGNDTLKGGLGDDTLSGDSGDDVLEGGAGYDTASYATAKAGVTVELGLSRAQDTGEAGIDTLMDIEYLTGSKFDDTLTNNNSLRNIRINGGAGKDLLGGDGGSGTLNGGAGDDRLGIAFGSYTLNGGAGDDVLDSLGGTATFNGGDGNDTLKAEFGTATLNGGDDNDRLKADSSKATLNGGAGDDALDSFNGTVTLNGGDGNDWLTSSLDRTATLNGGDGDDTLFASEPLIASEGNLTLNGGDGNDEVTFESRSGHSTIDGGSGADRLGHGFHGGNPGDSTVTFDYNAVSDSLAGTGRDTIAGFTGLGAGLGDQIDLTDIDANAMVAGKQSFIFGGPHTAGHLWYDSGFLNGNTDTDAGPEFQIQLVGAPALSVGGPGSDILL